MKTAFGYVTAHVVNMVKVTSVIENYLTVKPSKVETLVADTFYSSVEFSKATQLNEIPKGTVLTVEGLEYNSLGFPRLKVAQGYFTANKNYIKDISLQ